jgi:hypothetical protein
VAEIKPWRAFSASPRKEDAMNATLHDVQHLAQLSRNSEHSPDCPLWRDRREDVSRLIWDAVRHGRKSDDIQIVLAAVAECPVCRALYQGFSNTVREELYSLVRRLTESLGNSLYRGDATRAGLVWCTEDIEETFQARNSLQELKYSSETWAELFHAYCEALIEAMDKRYPGEHPFVYLTDRLIPVAWREDDVLDFIANRVNIDIGSMRTGINELAKLIKDRHRQAIEPLGWFVQEENGNGYFLIGWEDLLRPRGTEIGNRVIEWQETGVQVPNSRAKDVVIAETRSQPGEAPIPVTT